MKSITLALAMLFAIGLWAPVSADSTVSQQDTCKEGETWDDETKKCMPTPPKPADLGSHTPEFA